MELIVSGGGELGYTRIMKVQEGHWWYSFSSWITHKIPAIMAMRLSLDMSFTNDMSLNKFNMLFIIPAQFCTYLWSFRIPRLNIPTSDGNVWGRIVTLVRLAEGTGLKQSAGCPQSSTVATTNWSRFGSLPHQMAHNPYH